MARHRWKLYETQQTLEDTPILREKWSQQLAHHASSTSDTYGVGPNTKVENPMERSTERKTNKCVASNLHRDIRRQDQIRVRNITTIVWKEKHGFESAQQVNSSGTCEEIIGDFSSFKGQGRGALGSGKKIQGVRQPPALDKKRYHGQFLIREIQRFPAHRR